MAEMGEFEQPRTPENPEPAEAGGGGTGQDLRQRLEQLIREHDAGVTELKNAYQDEVFGVSDASRLNLRETIDIDAVKSMTESINVQMKQLVKIAQDPRTEQQLNFLPQLTVDILKQINADNITEGSSVILHQLIKYSLNADLTDADSLLELANAVNQAKASDEKLAQYVLKPILDRLEELGIHGSEIEKLEEFLGRPGMRALAPEIIVASQKYRANLASMHGTIADLPFTQEWLAAQERHFRTQFAGVDNAEDHIRNSIEITKDKVTSDLRINLDRMATSVGADQEQARLKFNAALKRYYDDGVIDRETFAELIEYPQRVEESRDRERLKKYMSRGGLAEGLQNYGLSFNEDQIALLGAMEDTDKFRDLIKNTYKLEKGKDNSINNTDGWKKLYGDIRSLFDEVFSIIDTRPNDFFGEAFNPLTRGQALEILVGAVDRLGRYASENLLLTDYWVPIRDSVDFVDKNQIGDAAKERLMTLNEKDVDLPTAILNYVTNKMTVHRTQTEVFHNIEAISEKGMGFEALAQQSLIVNQADVDFLWADDPDLKDAYNYQMTNLVAFLGDNFHILTGAFGKPDAIYRLNEIQLTTFRQLMAQKNTAGMSREEIGRLERQVRRKVRMASAIAKGVTTEYWGKILAARFHHSYDVYDNQDPHKGTIHNPQKYFRDEARKDLRGSGRNFTEDEVTRHAMRLQKERIMYKTRQTFSSGNERGIEKMMGELDLDLVLQKFRVPRYFEVFRYIPVPRNITGEDVPGPTLRGKNKKYRNADHTTYYEVRGMAEDAYYAGRVNELADLDDDFVLYGEKLKTDSIDLMHRAGWRFVQYRSFIAELVDRGKKGMVIPFRETMQNVKGLGAFGVKAMIDDKDYVFSRLDFDEVVDFLNQATRNIQKDTGPNAPSQPVLTKADFHRGDTAFDPNRPESERNKFIPDYGKFKKICYDRLVLGRIADIYPSRYIGMEMPRWSTRGEVFIRTTLLEFLDDRFADLPEELRQTHLHSLFKNSLTLVEKLAWELDAVDAQGNTLQRHKDAPIGQDLFTEAYFDHFRTQIEYYARSFIQDFGRSEFKGQEMSLKSLFDDPNDPNKFMDALKEYYRKLKQNIEAPRWTRENHGGDQETIAQRYSNLILNSASGIEYLIGGEDFDYSSFLMHQGGVRATERALNEVVKLVKEQHPGLKDLLNDGIFDFAKHTYDSDEELEKAIDQHLTPHIKKIYQAIYNIDKEQADEYIVRLVIGLARILGKDFKFRTKGWGWMKSTFYRMMTGQRLEEHGVHRKVFGIKFKTPGKKGPGRQDALIADFLTPTIHRPVTRLDGSQIYLLMEHLLNEVNVPLNRPTDGFKIVKDGLFKKKVPIYRSNNKGSIEGALAAEGLDKVSLRFLQSYAPTAVVALALALAAMAKLAYDKDNKQ